MGGRRPARRSADRTRAPGCRAGCADLHRTPRLVHPTRQKRDRQVNVTGLVAAAFTATPGPVTRIYTPTSPSRTRYRPSTDAGSSTDGCAVRRPWRHRRPTTPPWSIISATGWGCGSRTARTLIREAADSGDRRCRPGAEPAVVYPAVLIKDRQGVLAARFQRDHGRPPTPVEAAGAAGHLGNQGRQTRTPYAGRAAHRLACRPPKRSADLTRSKP